MIRTAIVAAVPFLLTGGMTLAGPATDHGAAHLVAVFQTYLGATPGVIGVVADGDAYDLTLDATPLIALAGQSGVTGTVTPVKMTLTDNGDDTWGVMQDQVMSISISVPGTLDLKEDIARITFQGVFDEKLMSFSSGKGEFNGLTVSETLTPPNQPPTHVEIAVEKGTVNLTAIANATGGVDSDTNISATGLSETLTLPPMAEGQPAIPVTIRAESLIETAKGTGLMMDGIYKTIAWVVAHPDEASMKADRAGLKGILSDALPVFGNVTGSGEATKLSVDTPMGLLGIDEAAFEIDMNGAVADGKFREAFSLAGLTLPAGIVPDWAAPILPQKLSLDVQVTDFDPEGAARVALGLFDLPDGTEPDAVFEAALLAALLPEGKMTIALNPGAVTGDGYALTYEGAMVAGPQMPSPTGTARITLTGIDRLSAALANAPDEVKGQATMGIGMAQGMAKPGDNGELVWDIDASKPGSLSVNGVQMMGGN
jgi:hypothetical protein